MIFFKDFIFTIEKRNPKKNRHLSKFPKRHKNFDIYKKVNLVQNEKFSNVCFFRKFQKRQNFGSLKKKRFFSKDLFLYFKNPKVFKKFVFIYFEQKIKISKKIHINLSKFPKKHKKVKLVQNANFQIIVFFENFIKGKSLEVFKKYIFFQDFEIFFE